MTAELSQWQRNILRIVEDGHGVNGKAMTPAQREECDALVKAGRLVHDAGQQGFQFGVYRQAIVVRGAAMPDRAEY